MPPGGDGGRLSSPPSKAAFDAAAAAAGLAPWNSRSSSSPSEKRPLTLYARPAAAPLLRLAARAARGALAAHERSLGTRYALPHLQIIAVPDFSANAMENWGARKGRERESVLSRLFIGESESESESARGREERNKKERKEERRRKVLSHPPSLSPK